MGGRPFVIDVESKEFRDFFEFGGLVDLGFISPRFTWYKSWLGGARVWEKIDRMFATASWIQRYPFDQVHHLPMIASDHHMLLVTIDTSLSFQSLF